MMMILIISAAGFLLLLGLVLFVLRRRPAWLAAVIALTASGVLLLFSLTGAISKPIIIEIPDGVDEAEANAIVELVLKREYLSVLYGPGFRDYWLGNIKLLSISGTNGLIELVLIDTFNWKSEINQQRRLAGLVQERIENLLKDAAGVGVRPRNGNSVGSLPERYSQKKSCA